MKSIVISNSYEKEFIYKLPLVLNYLLKEQATKKELMKSNIVKYIIKTYQVKLSEIVKAIKDATIISHSKTSYLLSIDPIARIKGNNLLQILHLLDYGDLEHKGTYLVTDCLRYLENNIENMHSIYIMNGGKFPWE